ncbi:hypothetical protein [uncultured Clostridium sp.]|uniref:hypothetical protein n=1 Tax=uncultured Clostridium sp. TaxID=59620 RepID=UPI00263466DB|nr:hypothetical protein [uncultured Clostridium sp.]
MDKKEIGLFIRINEMDHKLHTSSIKGKNIFAYLELKQFLQESKNNNITDIENNKEYLTLISNLCCTFLRIDLSATQLLNNSHLDEIKDKVKVLYDYIQYLIEPLLQQAFKQFITIKEDVVKKKSVFDEYDKEKNIKKYEDNAENQLNILLSLYNIGMEKNQSFYDIDEKIDFIRFLKWVDYYFNIIKPLEEEQMKNENP